jgi:hypothetical protein
MLSLLSRNRGRQEAVVLSNAPSGDGSCSSLNGQLNQRGAEFKQIRDHCGCVGIEPIHA